MPPASGWSACTEGTQPGPTLTIVRDPVQDAELPVAHISKDDSLVPSIHNEEDNDLPRGYR